MPSVVSVDFVGNVQSRKWNKEQVARFKEAGKQLRVVEDAEDSDEEGDEEEASDSDDAYETELSELCE
jgi:hypothetical protein